MSTLNYSNSMTFYYPNNQLNSYWNKVLLSNLILLMLISVLTILGNTLVLVATWKDRRLHEPNKYFVVCLAIADLMVGAIVVPITIYQRFNQLTRENYRLIPLCHFYMWIDAFAATVSIYIMTFISFDRYLKISKPLHYRSRITTSTSLKVTLVIFLVSIVYATFYVLQFDGCYNAVDNGYFTFIAVAVFILPVVIMVIMYTLIFRVAHKRQKMLRNGELGQTFNDRNVGSVLLQDLKTVRMLIIVVGTFIICWGPFFIWSMLIHYKPELIYSKNIKFWLTMPLIISSLAPMKSLCNPIIYAFLDQKYREAFKYLFEKLMRRPISRRPEHPNAMELRNRNQPTT